MLKASYFPKDILLQAYRRVALVIHGEVYEVPKAYSRRACYGVLEMESMLKSRRIIGPNARCPWLGQAMEWNST